MSRRHRLAAIDVVHILAAIDVVHILAAIDVVHILAAIDVVHILAAIDIVHILAVHIMAAARPRQQAITYFPDEFPISHNYFLLIKNYNRY